MMTYIILTVTVLFLALIGLIVALYYRNNEIIDSITTLEHGVEELESFTYYSESEIKDWIEDGIRDLQYDVDNHSSELENLGYDKANNEYVDTEIEDLHKKVFAAINEDAENTSVQLGNHHRRIKNITKFLSKTSGYQPEPVRAIGADFEEYCKSFEKMETWSDKRLAEHYKCLALMIDDGVYHPDYRGMGCETTYKYYLELTKGDSKDEMGDKETVNS